MSIKSSGPPLDLRGDHSLSDDNLQGDDKPKPQRKDSKALMLQIPGETKFEKFQFMRGMGYSEDEIKLHLHIKTHNQFQVMDSRAASQVESYLRYQARSGHIQNLTNALKIQWKNVFALEKRANAISLLCDNNPKNHKFAYADSHVRQTLNSAVTLVVEMQEKTPLADAFNLFIKKNVLEAGTKGKTNNIHKLPVTPKELSN